MRLTPCYLVRVVRHEIHTSLSGTSCPTQDQATGPFFPHQQHLANYFSDRFFLRENTQLTIMREDEAGRFGKRFPRADTSTVMTWKADGDKDGVMEGNLIVGSKGVREAEACVYRL